MAHISIKTRKNGNAYRYLQWSERRGEVVKTFTIYLGPNAPKRRRGGGISFAVVGLASLGIKAATGKLEPFKEGRVPPPDPRSAPDTSVAQDAWKIKMSTMSDEAWQRHIAGVKAEKAAASKEYVADDNVKSDKTGDQSEAAKETQDGEGE